MTATGTSLSFTSNLNQRSFLSSPSLQDPNSSPMASLRPFLSLSPVSPAPNPTRPTNFHLLHSPLFSSSFKLVATKTRFAVRTAAVAGAEIADPVDDNQVVLLGPTTSEKPDDEATADYNWTEEWYPLYLTKDVPEDAPLGLTVFDKQLVLYRDGAGELHCHEDRCPHRLAKLSEGQLIDGRLECLYHGWQFEGEGKCVKIPQVIESDYEYVWNNFLTVEE